MPLLLNSDYNVADDNDMDVVPPPVDGDGDPVRVAACLHQD